MALYGFPEKLPPKPQDALPDTTEPNGPCPRCGRVSNFTAQIKYPVTFNGGALLNGPGGKSERDHDERVAILQCQGCGENLVVIEEKCIGGVPIREERKSGNVQWRGIHWWPSPGMRSSDPDLPTPVADAVAEGTRCLAARSPRAAVVMFRGALAEVVADRGSTAAKGQKTLAGQLKQMAADGALDATLADWADHIRVIGNAGAHPSTLAPVLMDEAEELARLIASMLDYLYLMPARVQRARAARP